jgi:hypothetical protein
MVWKGRSSQAYQPVRFELLWCHMSALLLLSPRLCVFSFLSILYVIFLSLRRGCMHCMCAVWLGPSFAWREHGWAWPAKVKRGRKTSRSRRQKVILWLVLMQVLTQSTNTKTEEMHMHNDIMHTIWWFGCSWCGTQGVVALKLSSIFAQKRFVPRQDYTPATHSQEKLFGQVTPFFRT